MVLGTTMMEKSTWALQRMHMMVRRKSKRCVFLSSRHYQAILPTLPPSIPLPRAAKKRLKEAARDGDNRLSKKARKLAESSQGPKNSILRHMQATGPGAANRAPAAKKESKCGCYLQTFSWIFGVGVCWKVSATKK